MGLNKNNFTILELAKKIAKLNHITNIQINSKNQFFKDSLVNKKDPRSYKVNFNKIKKKFPNFNNNLHNELLFLKKKLTELKGKNLLKNKKFYRLKQIEFYLKRKKVNKDLFIN